MTDDDERSRGGQPGNDNAVKHDISAERELMYQRLNPHEQENVVELATDLPDRHYVIVR
jgi:hypothetical protein